MANEKLNITETIKEGVRYGLKNFFPLLLMVILYVITIWIPYLNVGTTIGIYKAIIKIGRGETIDPTAIFAKENFKNLSGFFLLLGLLYIGIVVACFFLFLPGMIMSIAWGFAIYFFLDKKVSPLKSLQLSYDATFGNKWRIFAISLLCGILTSIICGLFALIPQAGPVLAGIASILCSAIIVAVEGVMYNFFSKIADGIMAEKKACCCGEAKPAAEVVDEVDDVKTEA